MRWLRAISDKLQKLVWAQLATRSPAENAFLLLIPVVGVITGLASMGIANLIAYFDSLR